MKPLVLISGLAPGGAERVTASLLMRLHTAGMCLPLCTVTSRHDGPLAAEVARAGLDRRDLGARRLADPAALARLIRLLRKERFDLVHAHGQDAGILAAVAARSVGARLVITRHVLDEPAGDWRQRMRDRMNRRAFRRADVPVAVSRAAAERLARLTGLPAGRIRVLPNGIDLQAFSRSEAGPARSRVLPSLGIPRDAPIVLFPAVLREGKGHDLFFEALPELRRRCPRVRVLLAGSGPLEEGLRKRGEPHRTVVRFLGHRTDIPQLMAASDLVILPSRSEALPTVLVEAAAAGRPVVATRVGGVPEVVEDGETGFLVEPGDLHGLIDAVATLVAVPERRAWMGERARFRARAHFSLDRQAVETVGLWRQALRPRAS